MKADARDEAICELVDRLVESGRLPAEERDETILALLKREALATTGMGAGVAVPHVKVDGVEEFIGAVGVSRRGVDFYAVDGKPVHVVFLFLSPDDDPKRHLQLMAHIAAICKNDHYLSLLRGAQSRDDIAELLREAEALLMGVDGPDDDDDDRTPDMPPEDSGDVAGV